jgi:hypothetical protein
MEHTNTYDVYRLMFDETNTEQVDTFIGTFDKFLDALVDWDIADSHYIFHSHEKVNIVGIQPSDEKFDFWKKHFAGFVKNYIPSVIDTSHLHQPPKGRHNNCAQSSYSYIYRGNVHNENNSDVTSPTAAKTSTQHTNQEPYQVPGPKSARLGRPAQLALPALPAKATCPA